MQLFCISAESLLATPVWERWPAETCFRGWVEQTVADIYYQEYRWMETTTWSCRHEHIEHFFK